MNDNTIKKNGDIGISINKMQAYLNMMQKRGYINAYLNEDGIFGSDTKSALKQFQAYMHLNIDGILHEETWDVLMKEVKALNERVIINVASNSYYLRLGSRGLDVYKLQQYYNKLCQYNDHLKEIDEDGLYGLQTKQAITQYQHYKHLQSDGLIGKLTWDTLVYDYFELE